MEVCGYCCWVMGSVFAVTLVYVSLVD